MKIETARLDLIPCTPSAMALIEHYTITERVKQHMYAIEDDILLFGWGTWFVMDHTRQQIIGDVGFKSKPDQDGVVEMLYQISHDAQGNGFATEALDAMIHWALAQDEVYKVTAKCESHNDAAIHVFKKLKMTPTATHHNVLQWEICQH